MTAGRLGKEQCAEARVLFFVFSSLYSSGWGGYNTFVKARLS
jgi:hypothetical protein